MEDANRCPQCGTEVEQQGECPACLLKLGLSGAVPAMPETQPEPEPRPPAPPPRRRLRWKFGWRWLAAAAAAAIAVLLLIFLVPGGPEAVTGPVVRFTIAPPDEATIEDFAVSPDGRRIAFTAGGFDGRTKLWWRGFDMPTGQELQGTGDAAAPFWSPDSRWIGFFAGGKLKRIDLGGGPPMTIADAPLAQGGSWSPQGVILFAGRGDAALLRVAASGGEVTPAGSGAVRLRWPFFLPDGDSFLAYGSAPDNGVYVGRLDSPEVRKLADGEAAIYSGGRLIYTRGGTLLSQSFDTNGLRLEGDPVPIRFAESVRAGGSRPPAFSAGQGVLAYRNGDALTPHTLMWLDRTGRQLDRVADPAEEGEFSLSPDGRSVAFTHASQGAGADLWVRNLSRGTATRLTFDGPGAASPQWSPDGRRIAYVASARGRTSIQAARPDGSGAQETILELPQSATLNDWSADGRFLIYTVRERDGKHALRMLPLEGDRKPAIALRGPFHFKQARLSPDGRWMAYVSDEAGRDDVYVQSFPPGSGKWMISNEGGARPMWRRDGRELFYVQTQRRLMSAALQAGAVIEAGVPRPLMELPGNGSFEVTPDGQRFLVSAPSREQRPEPLHIVLQWAAETP